MDTLKVACWNVEWMNKLWPDIVPSKYHVDRRSHIAEEIISINADVMCVEEGPRKPSDMQSYVDSFLPSYRLILRPDGEPWGVQGSQGIYFIVKDNSVNDAVLMPITEWYENAPRSWPIHYCTKR